MNRRRVEIIQQPRRGASSVTHRVLSDDAELVAVVGGAYERRIETVVTDVETGDELGAVTRDSRPGKRAVWLWWVDVEGVM